MALGNRRTPRRFDTYSKMEAGNVILVPAFALWLAWPRDLLEIFAMAAAIAACSGFLIVGAVYWHALHRRLRDRSASPARALTFVDRVEKPLLGVTAAAALATSALGIREGFTACVTAAGGLTLLAVLEYVNYYRVQLQHFDNMADFRRFISMRGLKRAHLSRDLARHRARRG